MSLRKLFVVAPLFFLLMALLWEFRLNRWAGVVRFEPTYERSGSQNMVTQPDPTPDQTTVISTTPSKAHPSPILSVNSSSDLRLLEHEDTFTLRLSSNSAESLQSLIVLSLRIEPDYRQIEASSGDGVTAIITFTDTMTNVFVKSASGVYEYSGPDFDGSLKRVTKLNIVDDMRFPDDRAIRLGPTKKPIKFLEFDDD